MLIVERYRELWGELGMIIGKVYNNNIVLSSNELDEEVIVMGRGLAFQKQKGDRLNEELIEKVFVLKNDGEESPLETLLQEIDMKELELVKEIILKAEQEMERTYSSGIYLTLTDHIHASIERAREDIFLPNPLLFEIKRFYPKEFQLALYALDQIASQFDLVFPESEAGFIALHLANNRATQEGLSLTIKSTELVRDILSIISKFFGIVFDETSLNYTRMVTHVQYFVQRILAEDAYEDEDEFLYQLIQSKYPKAFSCGLRVKAYIEKKENTKVLEAEMIYLVIHIQRVVRESEKYNTTQ